MYLLTSSNVSFLMKNLDRVCNEEFITGLSPSEIGCLRSVPVVSLNIIFIEQLASFSCI